MRGISEGPVASKRRRGRHLIGSLCSFSVGVIAASTASTYFSPHYLLNFADDVRVVAPVDPRENVNRNACIQTMKQCWLIRGQEASQRKRVEAERAAEKKRVEAAQKSGPKITVIGLPQMKKTKSVSAGNETEKLYDPSYPNIAIANEMARADHYVTDSLAYISSFEDGNNESFMGASNSEPTKPITLVVLTVNRSVPYLAVLVASLLRGNDPKTLDKEVNLHIANVERRPCRCHYQLFDELEARLPFATFHDWSRKYSVSELSNFGFGWNNTNRAQFVGGQQIDYTRALNLCLETGSAWCTIMEDDVILTHRYIEKFLQLVSQINAVENVLTVSSYNPHNDRFSKGRKITSNDYVKSKLYEDDRSARAYIDPSTSNVQYQLDSLTKTYGISSNSYPRGVIRDLLQFIKKQCKGTITDLCIMREWAASPSLKKAASPSLANHIGHYSEHRLGDDSMFEWMSSDVRFQIN